MINAKITGVGGYVPEKVYDNAYMESIVDTNDEWITRRTGIKERHISADNEYTTDMATIAAKRAIENAGLTPEDIDLILQQLHLITSHRLVLVLYKAILAR